MALGPNIVPELIAANAAEKIIDETIRRSVNKSKLHFWRMTLGIDEHTWYKYLYEKYIDAGWNSADWSVEEDGLCGVWLKATIPNLPEDDAK